MWKLWPDALTVLNDESARRSLERYFAVMQDEKPAKFMIAKKLSAEFEESESTQQLWQKHEALLKECCHIEKETGDTPRAFEKVKAPEILPRLENRNSEEDTLLLQFLRAKMRWR
jgi:putative pyruvate formate lyase activating enzyme